MIKRLFMFLIGMILVGLGVTLIIFANLGTGPWDTIFVGLYKQFGLSIGFWVFFVQFLLIFLISFISRKKPDFSVIFTIFVNGLTIDFWAKIVFSNVLIHNVFFQILIFISGIFILGFGAVIYIESKFPKTPIDGLMIALSERAKINLATSRSICEISALFVGFMIGGPIGIGTVIVSISIGPIIQLFLNGYKKIVSA